MTLVADEYLKPVTSLSCEKAALSLCSPRGFHLFANAGVTFFQEIGAGVGFELYDGFSVTRHRRISFDNALFGRL
jgi:hypothetical protein